MAYTPTNWSTGDTITASALNKIEQGIAGGGSANSANIKISCDGVNGSFVCTIGYARQVVGQNWLSIESSFYAGDINMSGYNKNMVFCVPFDPDDEFTPCVFLDEYFDANFNVTTTGGISSPIDGYELVGANSWASAPNACYPITGDGTITFSPK